MYELQFTEIAMTTWAVLRQTWTAVNKVAEVRLAKVGLTPEKAAVLWACRDFPGKLMPAEIARLMFRENQTIAGLLNRMETDGLVKRVPKRKGHPFTEVKMTDKGGEFCGPGVKAFKDVITGLVSELTKEEQEQLQKLLRVIRDRMVEELHIELRKPAGYDPDEPISPGW